MKIFFLNWKIEFTKNTEYEFAGWVDYEKQCFFKIGKENWLKIENMPLRDALIAKNYVLGHRNVNF